MFWKPENTMREAIIKIYDIFYNGSNEHPWGIDRADEFANNKDL